MVSFRILVELVLVEHTISLLLQNPPILRQVPCCYKLQIIRIVLTTIRPLCIINTLIDLLQAQLE